MILFLLSNLYAQEPSAEETDQPSSSEEETTPAGDGDSADASNKEEESSKTEKENVESSEDAPAEQGEEAVEEQEVPEEAATDESKDDTSAPQETSPSEEPLNIDVQEVPKELPVRKNGVVTLKNGDMVRGSILDGEDGVRIDVGGEEDVHVPESSILTLSYPKGKFMLEDMGYTRYFYAPTAMPMKPKTGYISQKELLFSAVAYSPTQDVSFLVGTSVPFTLLGLVYGEIGSLTGVAGFRYGTKVSDNFYVGGGVEAFFVGYNSLSLPFINATYGDSEQHVTIGGGLGLLDFDLDQAEFAPVFLSAYKRINPSIAIISENWLLTTPTTNYYDIPVSDDCGLEYAEECYTTETSTNWMQPSIEAMALSFGIRFISKKFTTDVGLINTFNSWGDYIPIPWLDVSWYFGQDTQ